jgi:moderate conductance mechanosensitive channel
MRLGVKCRRYLWQELAIYALPCLWRFARVLGMADINSRDTRLMRMRFSDLGGFFLLAVVFPCLVASPVTAQSKSPTPAVTQQLVDDLVNAISAAVVEKLKKDGSIARKPAEPPAAPVEPDQDVMADQVLAFAERAVFVLNGYPELWRNLTRIRVLLDKSGNGGRGLGAFLAMLFVAGAAALGSESLLRQALGSVRQRLARHISNTSDFWPLFGLVCFDALGLAAVWIVSYGFIAIWFRGSDEQARLAAAVVSVIFLWRLYMFAFRIFFRPGLSPARLVKLGDPDAWAIYWHVSAAIASIIALRLVSRILTAIKAPPEAQSAWQLSTSFLVLGLILWTAFSLRQPVAAWFSGMINMTEARPLKLAVARNWLAIAVPLFVVLFLAQVYGAITEHFTVSAALTLTVNLIIALLLFETLLHFIAKRIPVPAGGPTRVQPRAGDVMVRCTRVAVYIGVVITIIETWLVNVIGFVDADQWRSITHAALTAGGALFLAYVSWETIHFLTDSYIARNSPAAMGPAEEEGAAPPAATRLATILPLMRMAAFILIFAVAVLLVLSELGINITPLIAAVSIFGLAVSFGSQTLVRDIVSGIFYLADDAFRVGEYIDCGKAKGTVEGFTLRSIKLRHQNGQIYTIPFGQLGQITNFSRDWCTMKFNLRFARNTDVEKLRKTTKKVGLAMMEEPEFKDEFLQPLKLQGVADVADNALVMRFKFTAKPNIPTLIQREAMKRLFSAFQAAGIEFASATVSVQTIGRSIDQAAAAGAAANAAITPLDHGR